MSLAPLYTTSEDLYREARQEILGGLNKHVSELWNDVDIDKINEFTQRRNIIEFELTEKPE